MSQTAAFTPFQMVEALVTNGWVLFPQPEELPALLVEAQRRWREVVDARTSAQMEDTMSLMLYVGNNDGLQPEFDDGYLPRRGKSRPEDGVAHDSKDSFHHRIGNVSIYHNAGLMEHEDFRLFIRVIERLRHFRDQMVFDLAEGLDSHPMTASFKLGQGLVDHLWLSVQRFVVYDPCQEVRPSVVAKPHQDRSSFTRHNWQRGGRVQALINGQWENLPNPPGYSRLFNSMKVAEDTGGTFYRERRIVQGGVLKALDHRGESDPQKVGDRREASVDFLHHHPRRLQ